MTSVTKADATVRVGEYCSVQVFPSDAGVRIGMAGEAYNSKYVDVYKIEEKFVFKFNKVGTFVLTFFDGKSEWLVIVRVVDTNDDYPTVNVLKTIYLK